MGRRDLLVVGLLGGAVAMIGSMIVDKLSQSPATPPPPVGPGAIFFTPAPSPPVERSPCLVTSWVSPDPHERAERARRARVWAYRVRTGEVTLAQVDREISVDVADLLEGCRPLPCASAALPFDWTE